MRLLMAVSGGTMPGLLLSLDLLDHDARSSSGRILPSVFVPGWQGPAPRQRAGVLGKQCRLFPAGGWRDYIIPMPPIPHTLPTGHGRRGARPAKPFLEDSATMASVVRRGRRRRRSEAGSDLGRRFRRRMSPSARFGVVAEVGFLGLLDLVTASARRPRVLGV